MNNQQLKYIIAVLIFLFVCFYAVFAQTNDSIRVETSFLGIKYYKNNQKLYYQDLGEIFKPNPLAYKQYKSAIRTFNTSALVLCLGGGFIAGGTIMSYEPVLYGGEPDCLSFKI